MESLHLTYLKYNQKASYTQLCQYLYAKLRAASFPDADIDHLLTLKDKLSYVIYKTKLHLLNTEFDNVVDKLRCEVSAYEGFTQYSYLLHHFPDKQRYSTLAWIIAEERKKYSQLHSVEAGSVKDLQELTNAMDYLENARLAKYRKSCVIQQDVDFSHELSSVQEKFDMCYDSLLQQLNNLRSTIYRVDRDSSGMLRVMRSIYDITERNVELDIEKCRIRTDYMLFSLRHWRSMSQEIKHIFNNNPSMMAKLDLQMETSVRYIERLLTVSFVMIRQPDDINVMQTPSTQRILREREFVKGSFLAYNPTAHYPWINVTSPCTMYLVGLNEYKSTDSVFEHFSPTRKSAYEGDLYDSLSKGTRTSSCNPQKFTNGDVCFPRVHMINNHLKRRCREIHSSHKRKHEDVMNCNAAPEEIFSFVLSFEITYDLRARWNSFAEDVSATTRKLHVQTCSKPVAILVHASQKPLAEGRLFWCRFNPKWQLPLHEEGSVTVDTFKKTLFEYTCDNFGRELSGGELDYLISQISKDARQGHRLIAKSVLKDDAVYTDPPENPPKRKSFWCWYYDLLIFLGKGKGKPNAKSNMDSPLKKHWREGRICLLSRTQAQEILSKLSPNATGVVIRVSESKGRMLNLLSFGDQWGMGEKEVDSLDQTLLNKWSVIWSEVKQTWIRTDLVCEAKVLDNLNYKPLNSGALDCLSSPATPTGTPGTPNQCHTPHTPCEVMSPGHVGASPFHSYPPSPFINVQGEMWNSGQEGYIRNMSLPGNETHGSVNQPNFFPSSPVQGFNVQATVPVLQSPAGMPVTSPSYSGATPNNLFNMMTLTDRDHGAAGVPVSMHDFQ